MWEVDPETKSKVCSPSPLLSPFLPLPIDLQAHQTPTDPLPSLQLLVLQKQPANGICADCSNPSPQWASPKFGTFICLDCAGVHRGLGVHISFVRSVMMDSFKVSEVRRMEEGGNAAWHAFWEKHPDGGAGRVVAGSGAWDAMVADRYAGDVGEEYKERLAAKAEGREYVPPPKKERKGPAARAVGGGSGAGSPMGRASPGPGSGSPAVGGRKEKNEAYFAKMGQDNANRSADLPPSQGGKYAGFGSAPAPEPAGGSAGGQGIPGVDEFQKDPVAALSKGFGWFTSTVGKSAKSVNEGWIQPSVQKVGATVRRRVVSAC